MTIRSITLASVTLLAVLSGIAAVRSGNDASRNWLQSTPTEDPTEILTKAETGDPCGILAKQGSLKSFGCGVISYMVKNTELPDWETNWSTKCDLNLEQCPVPSGSVTPELASEPAKAGASPSTNSDKYSKAIKSLTKFELRLLQSAKVPVQLRGDHETLGTPANGSADLTLASVLFNNTAKAVLSGAPGTLASHLRQRAIPQFQPGSVIAKAVWGIFPLDDQGNIAAGTPVFASILQTTDSTKPTYEASWIKQYGATFPNPISDLNWKNYDQVKSAWTVPAASSHWKFDAANCLVEPGQLPWNCMNYMSISPSLKQAAQLLQDQQDGLTINTACGDAPKCNIALMGIHFMVRLRDKDPLPGKRASSWVFITLWWTGIDNGTNLPSPWKYYQINVTEDFKNDPPNIGPASNVAFNPYLEGKLALGAASNCLNCHYYAAYSASNLTSMGSTGTDIQHGMKYQDITRFPSKGCASNQDYPGQQNVVCTDFVWSTANVPLQVPQPPSQP